MNDIYFYIREEPYGWMSNFWRAQQVVYYAPGLCKIYLTNEHYYQSEKAKDRSVKEWIRSAPTAWAAMCAGRALRPKEIVDNWKDKKVEVMYTGLKAKFASNPDLAAFLLETGDAALHENSPTDMFWGVKGEDMLGKLLMRVREELRNHD